MVKTFFPALGLVLLTASFFAIQEKERERVDEDRVLVERAMNDYVKGFYEARPELIERGVSKDLKKMGYWRPADADEYRDASHMTYEQAIELAKTWNLDGKQGELKEPELEIYEVLDKTACGKLTAHWGVDYFHLVKEGDEWKIHHVLWQSAPPESNEVSSKDEGAKREDGR